MYAVIVRLFQNTPFFCYKFGIEKYNMTVNIWWIGRGFWTDIKIRYPSIWFKGRAGRFRHRNPEPHSLSPTLMLGVAAGEICCPGTRGVRVGWPLRSGPQPSTIDQPSARNKGKNIKTLPREFITGRKSQFRGFTSRPSKALDLNSFIWQSIFTTRNALVKPQLQS